MNNQFCEFFQLIDLAMFINHSRHVTSQIKMKKCKTKKKFESVVFGSMKIKGGSKVIPFVKL